MMQRSIINFLTDVSGEEVQKVSTLVDTANDTIDRYFGIVTTFDVLICRGSWEMEVQIISRRKEASDGSIYSDTKFVGMTDYRLQEIVIRYDIAKYGHYLHELIHGVISKSHTHQLREGLAWYFTLKLTEDYRYVRPSYPSWVDEMYVYPIKRLAEIVGEEFLKDFAIGRASLDHETLPKDVQELFLPEEIFYAEKRHRK
ncbi:MAG: hypothetical protein QXX64_01950 [Nitrososphaera sp.]|uniref:Uncharacterized protein n=1 Tax=Nitrososphaera gargensis (strain Ga9.2) TaxID=1237085 RepID=K0IM43_NITGG|nr:hypothetical protein [Candidatus Nitrososphaera gargensis]AFU57544.1 hypothetical protein Ngar_c06010 [Candidatus Nitrososphaera gargensis Ga9.2]